MSKKITLSFSKIFTYSQCGIKYELKYVKEVPVPCSPFSFLGRSVHKAVENLYNARIEGKEVRMQDVKDIAVESFKNEYEDIMNSPAPGLFLDDKLPDEKKVLSLIEKSVVKMTMQYFDTRIKNTTPLMVEQGFSLDLQEEAPKYCEDYDGSLDDVLVIGYIDFVDSGENIIDLKTSARRPQSDAADRSDQLTMYALGYVVETGLFPNQVTLDYIVHDWINNPEKPPLIVTLSSKRSKRDIERFLNRLVRIIKGIKAGVFLPPDPNSWACAYCPYRHLGYCKLGY